MDRIVISVKVRLIAASCGLAFGAVFVIVMLVKDLSMWMTVPMWLAIALAVVSAFSLLALWALEVKKRSLKQKTKDKE